MTVLDDFPRTPEMSELRRRHAQFFAALSDQAVRELIPDGIPAPQAVAERWFTLLDAEQDNLRTAIAWAAEEGDAATVGRLTLALGRWLLKRRSYDEALRWCDGALAADDRLDPELHAAVGILATQHALAAGEYERAHTLIAAAVEASRRTELPILQVRALRTAGDVYGYAARYQDAREAVEEAVAVCRTVDDDVQLAWTLLRRADFLTHNDVAELAEPALREALAAFRRLSDGRHLAVAASQLGAGFARLGRYDDAVSVVDGGITAAGRVGEDETHADLWYILGQLRLVVGDVDQARAAFGEARRRYERDASPAHAAWCVMGEARTLVIAGETGEAQAVLEQALDGVRELTNKGAEEHWLEAGLLGDLAEVARHQGDESKAVAFLEAAVVTPSTEGSVFPLVHRRRLAELAEHAGDVTAARRWYEEALAATLRWREGDEDNLGAVLVEARLARLDGDLERERDLLDRGEALARQVRAEMVPRILREAAEAALRRGDLSSATTRADEACAVASEAGTPRAIAECALVRAEVAMAAGDAVTASARLASVDRRHLVIPTGYLGWDPVGDPTLQRRFDAVAGWTTGR